MNVSRYSVSTKTKPVEAPVVTPAPAPKKKERPYRIARYRGIAFFYAIKGDQAVIHTWNEITNTPNQGIAIPKNQIEAAKRCLAKIQLAESELEQLGAKSL